MANTKQLELLKEGVYGWNKWRKKEPDKRVDLKKADLRKAHLRGADLRKAHLNEAYLSGADLINANLTYANLSGADLRKARLNNANLIRANLRKARLSRADFYRANLTYANLSGADLSGADLMNTDLAHANLSRTDLRKARLCFADLTAANLTYANLSGADLLGADLLIANLRRANLTYANLCKTDFAEADLSGANLSEALLLHSNLVQTNISHAKISKSHVYGVSVWDLKGEFKEQKDLIISRSSESSVRVDNIKVAQFVYLLLNNREIRDVIDTLTSKAVLILGRFTIPKRKAVLDTLRNKLRKYDLLPIVFDFDRPTNRDFTETIKTLAGISYFVIADITNPKSSPLELQATIPDYQIPFVPIIEEGEKPFAMMANLKTKYNWVLDTISYDSLDTLIEILKPHIIDPAIKKRDELRLIKAKEPTILSGRKLKETKKKGKP